MLYFQVLSKAHNRGRPKLVDPQADYNDIILRHPLSFLVQWYELRAGLANADDEHEPTLHVHCMGDPEWVGYNVLLTSEKLESVTHYRETTPSLVHPTCITWSSPVQAVPRMALMDKSCPVLWVCRALLGQGWKLIQLSISLHSPSHGLYSLSRFTSMVLPRLLTLCGFRGALRIPQVGFPVSIMKAGKIGGRRRSRWALHVWLV